MIPAAIAPVATPMVKAVFSMPLKRPRRLGLVSCTRRIIETLEMPAAPTPETTLPINNTANEGANAVIRPPMAVMSDDVKMQYRGEKM